MAARGVDGPVELCLCLRFTRDVPHPRQTRPSTNVIAIPRVPITVNVRVQRDVRAVAALAACRMLDEIAWSCGYPRSELFDENGNPVAHVVKLLEY